VSFKPILVHRISLKPEIKLHESNTEGIALDKSLALQAIKGRSEMSKIIE
jgi:hypothetical protein